MSDSQKFNEQRKTITKKVANITSHKQLEIDLFQNQYTYSFDWCGLPIIQYPQDMIAIQEIIWQTKPDIIIETGVARGGSIIFYASLLQLLGNQGKVIGIDIDIRAHNRKAIEKHPLSRNVHLIEGSSTESTTIDHVKAFIHEGEKVMVILDSNHTHDHVLKELELYSPLVTKECYCVVLDTIVEDLPNELFHDRPWGKGNNPKTAVHEFLKTSKDFKIVEDIPNKLVLTVAPDGYLLRV